MSAPDCTIVIPTYNRLPFLLKAIESVRSQTFQDWELLVVDDGSSDGSFDAIAACAATDPRIRVIRNEGVHGPGGARNLGMREALGPLIAFLDSDDLWDTDKLACFMAAAAREPDAVLIGSDYRMIDHGSGQTTTMRDKIEQIMLPWWEQYDRTKSLLPCRDFRQDRSLLARRDVVLNMTIGGFLWIHTSSAMVRRDAALSIRGFDEKLLRTEDIDLWLRLNETGRFVFIDRALATYDTTGRDGGSGERYAGQDGARRHTAYDEWAHHLALMQRIRQRFPLSKAQNALMDDRLQFFHRNCADAARQAGKWRRFLHHRWQGRDR